MFSRISTRPKTWGQLSPDGNLEWGICAEKQIWVRAGRKGPPYYVCEDDRSVRVCVFDKFMATERIYDEETQSIFLRKELFLIWSAMAEAGVGKFGPENTLLLDECTKLSSHPDNVMEVPDWELDETGRILADVSAHVDSLISSRQKSGQTKDKQ